MAPIHNSNDLATEFLARFKGRLALSYAAAIGIGFLLGAVIF